MNIIDTSIFTDRISEGKRIDEDVSMISIIEYPMLLEYAGFSGRIVEPDLSDLKLAHDLQRKLASRGKMKGAADLIIAATCIHLGASLITSDKGFEDISKVSELKVVWK